MAGPCWRGEGCGWRRRDRCCDQDYTVTTGAAHDSERVVALDAKLMRGIDPRLGWIIKLADFGNVLAKNQAGNRAIANFRQVIRNA